MSRNNSSEIQWKEGIVISDRPTIFDFDNDTWNDNEILEVFDAAIRSHRSKGKKKENSQSKKEIRSPKNVHFATAHEENIVLDPLEDEIGNLPPSIRWEDAIEINQVSEVVQRSPRVNFDLDSSVLVAPDSTTHTDTEGSDCGNGGSDSSASFSRKSNHHNHNHNHSSNSTSSSRRRQNSNQNSQISTKKKSGGNSNETITNESSTIMTPQPISPISSYPIFPLLPVSSSLTTTTLATTNINNNINNNNNNNNNNAHTESNDNVNTTTTTTTTIQPSIPMTPNSNSDPYQTPHIQPTQYPVPPTPYPHQTSQLNPATYSPLPFPPLPIGQSTQSIPSYPQIHPHFPQPQPQSQPQPQLQSPRLQIPSYGVNPEMESLLTDMLMAWYQSGYTTGRYYTFLEQQQQSMQQWYAYYHSNTQNTQNNQNNMNYNQNNNNNNNFSTGGNVEGTPK